MSFPADTPGTVVFSAQLPLADTTPYLLGFPLNTFSEPRLVQLSVTGMIDAVNIPAEYLPRNYGPNGWYAGNLATTAVFVFYGSTALSPAYPGDHTSDPTNSKLTVVTGAGELNRGQGFGCDAVMPKNCWQYSYPAGPQTVTVKVLDVPIALEAQVGGTPVTSHIPAQWVWFQWYMPAWAQNAGGPAGPTPYKTQQWVFYPDGGTPIVLPISAIDSIHRYRQYQVTQSGRMEVTVRVNGVVKTASDSVVVRCITGDTLLDKKLLADSMEAAWDSSHTERSNASQRREQGGTYFSDPATGQPVVQTNFNDPLNTPCTSQELWGSSLASGVIFHTHPIPVNAPFPFNCPWQYQGGNAGGESRFQLKFR